MRNKNLMSYSIVLFVLAQVTWFALLTLFVYRFFMGENTIAQVGLIPVADSNSTLMSALVLIGGCLLYVAVSVALAIIFKNLSAQLRLTSMYDTFIANMTHELKSPLASIQLYLETLSYRSVPQERQQEFLGRMLKDTSRLQNLINSILKIAILEQKRDIFEVQLFQAEKVITELIHDGAEQFKLPQGAITISGEAPVDCVIDKNALKIAFDNLIDNALKYTKQPLKISVGLATTHKNILISFTDNGIGITSPNQKRIFQKFVRLYNKNMPNVKGTGLGLYWVREIIKYHGGNISVFSAGADKGTTFNIHLPIYNVSKTRYLNNLLKWAKRKQSEKNQNDG